MEPPIRIVHGRYEVGELLGEGGDATVYRAHDRHLDRTVAVKFLRPSLRADSTFVLRFEREARGAAQLDHPHIVPVYDYGEQDGHYFLVMQYLGGGDLRALLGDGKPLPLDFAMRVAIEVADALGAAHARGIVHRDIKPANILLTTEGRVKVTDFGIAKLLDVPGLTATAAMVGSAQYMAPEQANGGKITPAADVYSLGLVLYEMLAGRRPFDGTTFVQVVLQHLHATPPPLEDLNPDVPQPVAEVVTWALAKDPALRFADGSRFAATLRELQAEPTLVYASARPAAGVTAPANVVGAGGAAPAVPGEQAAAATDALGKTVAAGMVTAPHPGLADELQVPAAAGPKDGADGAPALAGVASAEPTEAPPGWRVPIPEEHPTPSEPTGRGEATSFAETAEEPATITPGAESVSADQFADTRTLPGLPIPPPAGGPDERNARWRRGPLAAERPGQRDPSLVPVAVVLVLGLLVALLVGGGALLGSGVALGGRESTANSSAAAGAGSETPTGDVAGRMAETERASGELPAAAETAAPTAGPTEAPSRAAAAATAAPTAAPTVAPTQAPSATAGPTAAPSATAVVATQAEPAPAPPVARGRVTLEDDAFEGGFSAPRNYRGRTARWLYGALSPYGQMTASFNVEGTPGAGELVISGIDSENGPKTPIAIVLNDTTIFNGGNPLPKDHWRGDLAPWGTATIPIPAGVLKPGRNTLTFKNLVPTNNYNAPPYFMLDQATINY